MCGIAGIINLDGRIAEAAELRRATNAMRHRGPDDEGVYVDGSVGLAMRRLSIIDVGGGHQPISNEDGSVTVVMNGEIYNYIEIRDTLKRRGHVFRTASDTEVILHLYEEIGVKAVQELNGMFAFALWDARRGVLWLARDRLGIKPLFYQRSPNRFAFGSDITALRKITDAPFKDAALVPYLALAYVPEQDTFFSGIKRLPAATYLLVSKGAIAATRYWEIRNVGTWKGTADDAKQQLRDLLSDSARLQLRSDVPIGLFLSGGVDSSCVAASAARWLNDPVRTLTIDFAGKSGSDAHFARDVANQYRFIHTEVKMDARDAIECLDELIPRLDEPIADTALIPSYLLSKRARELGLRVLLTGAGGDELFGGYNRHWPARLGTPDWIATMLPRSVRMILGQLASWQDYDRGARAGDPRLAWGIGISGVSLATCRAILRDQDKVRRVSDAIKNEFSELPTIEAVHGRMHGRMLTDLRKYLVEDVLSLNDKTTMAASVEGRVPLLDHRLVEFAFALPPAINFSGARAKGLLRSVLSTDLPRELLERRKEGFNAPVQSWTAEQQIIDLREELIGRAVPPVDDLIEPRRLERVLRDPRARRRGAVTLFALYMFNRWYRVHVL